MSTPDQVLASELLEPLARTQDWLLSLRDGEGRIVCPEHRIEHTGKSACVVISACELFRWTGAERWAAAAVQQARRLVLRLEREGTSPCHTFRPGRHDPYNCSNAVIDGGACSDALAHVVQSLGPRLTDDDRAAFRAASLLHARTYLRYAVLDKGVPAQRAWGLTGLAGAHSLEADPQLESAGLEAVGVLEAIQHADGSYPYHPLEWGAEHPGASDVSSFYQSRVTAFLLHALATMGRDPRGELFRPPLVRGLEFLLALQGVDGIKTGLVEAKPWYFGATYEVASNPFDVFALARGWRLFGQERYGRAALAALRAWVAHLDAHGMPRSHLPGPGRGRSYQCPLFWAAHACWIARAAGDVQDLLRALPAPATVRGAGIDLRVTRFADVGLVRLEDDRVIAWVRGARPPFNVHHGSPHGAGLLRVQRVRDGRELLARCRLGGHQEGEWSGALGLPSLARGWRSGGRELPFSLWLARVHWRARRPLAALRAPLAVLARGVLAFAHPRVGSAFFREPEVALFDGGVALQSGLARRDGTPVSGSTLERTFRVDGQGLEVSERLVSAGGARRVRYSFPRAAVETARIERVVRYRLA